MVPILIARRVLLLSSYAIIIVLILIYSRPYLDSTKERLKSFITFPNGTPNHAASQVASHTAESAGRPSGARSVSSSPGSTALSAAAAATVKVSSIGAATTTTTTTTSTTISKLSRLTKVTKTTKAAAAAATPRRAATGRLHYLVPASKANLQLCYNLVSAVANRHPIPMLLGWNAMGDFDAALTHIAKVRNVKRYLDSLQPDEDDDLVLIVDGYDIIMQLPPEIVITRYFEVAHKADEHLAQRLGLSLEQLQAKQMRQTVFWGPDKVCWPMGNEEPRCSAAPPSTLDRFAFGPKSWNGDVDFADPRWLNSGTMIGPVNDVRSVFNATLAEVASTYNSSYEFRESDQFYISNLWGHQEEWRAQQAAGSAKTTKAKGGDGPAERAKAKTRPGEEPEFHMAIEYESAIFQTDAGYRSFLGQLQFNETGLSVTVDRDVIGLGDEFRQHTIRMPTNVATALSRLYDAVPEAHPGKQSADWLKTAVLGVNHVSKHIYALWHCAGPNKSLLQTTYEGMWWYPYARWLVKAAVKSSRAKEPIAKGRIDGRLWEAKAPLPAGAAAKEIGDAAKDPYGGFWTDDEKGDRFVAWADVCGPYEKELFADAPKKRLA